MVLLPMFRRSETPQHERETGMLRRVYHQGFDARLEGLPRKPPASYEDLLGVDLVGAWAAGWDGAHQELATRR